MTNLDQQVHKQFEIIVGSMLGASEYVAEALQHTLEASGHKVVIHLDPDIGDIDPDGFWLLCSSTHGAGDLPDNIQPFAGQLATTSLSNDFAVVGLGDSSYDTFCHGAKQLESLMLRAGANKKIDSLHIDVLTHPVPEEVATQWLSDRLDRL